MTHETVEKVLAALGFNHNDLTDPSAYKIEYDLVKKALGALETISKDKVLYKVFDLNNKEHSQFIHDKILIGTSIKRFLGAPSQLILCATTLGSRVDTLIRKEGIMSISSAVLIDTAAMVVIEEHLNLWMETIALTEPLKGHYLSPRYSPGYGDMPLSMQKDILQELQSQKQIGLTVSDSGILLPKKSVTAVIGVYDTPFETTYSNCDSCLIRNRCKKRERGDYCGY